MNQVDSGLLGRIANPPMADVLGALDYRQKRIEQDEEKRKELRRNALIAESLPKMSDDSLIKKLFLEDPQIGAAVAKAMGIPLNEGERFDKLGRTVGEMARLAEADPRAAYDYALSIQAENRRAGVEDTHIDNWIGMVDKNPLAAYNSLYVLNQSLNPVKQKEKDELGWAKLELEKNKFEYEKNNPKATDATLQSQDFDKWQRLKAAGHPDAEGFGRSKGFLMPWSQDAGVQGSKTRTVEQIKSANKLIDDYYNKSQAINLSIENYQKGADLIDKGAGSGVIENFLPSFTAATQELNNIKLKLGADVLSSGVFGAQVSDRDVKNAFEMAAPPLDEKELKRWMLERKESQKKVRNIYERAIKYLADGHTIADLSTMVADERNKQESTEKEKPKTGATNTQETAAQRYARLSGGK